MASLQDQQIIRTKGSEMTVNKYALGAAKAAQLALTAQSKEEARHFFLMARALWAKS